MSSQLLRSVSRGIPGVSINARVRTTGRLDLFGGGVRVKSMTTFSVAALRGPGICQYGSKVTRAISAAN